MWRRVEGYNFSRSDAAHHQLGGVALDMLHQVPGILALAVACTSDSIIYISRMAFPTLQASVSAS